MGGILVLNESDMINSLELLKEINWWRKQDNSKDLKHNDLMKIIRDEFSDEISLGKISQSTYTNTRNREYPCFVLTINQAKQVLVRESKFVRKAVIKRLDILENKLKEIQKPKTVLELIQLTASEMQKIQGKVQQLENKFDSVVTLESGKQRQIQKAVAKRVYERDQLLGYASFGKSEEEKLRQKNRKKLFSSLYRELKNKFGVASYKDIKVSEFETAINYINNWIEDKEMV